MDNENNLSKKLIISVFLVSMAVLLFEISLMRYFSVILFPSMAFMGITVAMFGLTFGGLLVYVFPKIFLSEKNKIILSVSVAAIGLSQIYFSFLMPSYNAYENLFSIFIMLFLVSLPFIFASVFLTIIFTNFSSFIGKIYSSDLVGAGVGVIAAVLLMNYINITEVVI